MFYKKKFLPLRPSIYKKNLIALQPSARTRSWKKIMVNVNWQCHVTCLPMVPPRDCRALSKLSVDTQRGGECGGEASLA